jgi:hypothetical protein
MMIYNIFFVQISLVCLLNAILFIKRFKRSQNVYNSIFLSTNKEFLDIFLRNKKELKDLNREYNKNHISFNEFHGKLIDFLLDFIDNPRYKEIFGYQNIELLNRQLANVTTLSSRLEEYRAIGNDEKKIELTKELSFYESEILGRLEKCNDYYNSKFLISEKSSLINEITTTTTITEESVTFGASNNQDAVQNAAYLNRNKIDDQKATLNKLCFVDMSFGKKKDPYTGIEVDFDQIYEKAIKPAIIGANLEPLRGDEEKRGGIVHQAMFARLLLSEYVIADLTTANANVYYELGIRHAARPFTTILLHGNLHPLPFDIAPNRTFMYNIEKDGTISDKSCLQLKEGLRAKLDTIINNGASQDSPLFELIRNYKKIDLPSELKENFQDRLKLEKNFNDQLDRAKSHNNGTEKLRILQEIRASLGNIKDKNDNILTNLLLAFRSVSAWEDMIQLCESFSYDLRNSYMIQQQEAFALNRRNSPNDREKAIKILNEVSLISGVDPETMGLLGRIYKDMYKDSKKNNDKDAALGYLDKALETYKKGFYSDPREYYPGINAVTLLIEKGDKQSYGTAKELITSIKVSLDRRGGLESENYWDIATNLEIACIENDSKLIDKLMPKLSILAKETFMPETTKENIMILRNSLPKFYKKEKQDLLIKNLDRVVSSLDMYHKKLMNG